MARVALIHCASYEEVAVKAAVDRGLALLGGAGRFARSGERILLKPNMVAADPPERCSTTHPAVFKAVAQAFLATGAVIRYGDSPGLGNIESSLRKSGLQQAAESLGVELADFRTGQEVFFAEGRQNRKFVIARGVLDCDGLISLPKLKTHGLERLTGAIKNQFGCVPGMLKGEFHVKLPGADAFARMLVDLNRLVKPRLYVMDGIRAMEGNGPRGGTPVAMNLLLLSEDPVALDATVCRLVAVQPEKVPTVKYGAAWGAGAAAADGIDLVGDAFHIFRRPDFKLDRSAVRPLKNAFLRRHLNRHLVPRPEIRPGRCVRCGICVGMCPVQPKAVRWKKDDHSSPPVHDYEICIRCYCCQEMCPESAIELRIPRLRRLLDALMRGVTAPQRVRHI
jgi:uncharacterized protein (DUF362 family)/NAD-dependent dihydropyrimidine dehydrogenase PreA subunit